MPGHGTSSSIVVDSEQIVHATKVRLAGPEGFPSLGIAGKNRRADSVRVTLWFTSRAVSATVTVVQMV